MKIKGKRKLGKVLLSFLCLMGAIGVIKAEAKLGDSGYIKTTSEETVRNLLGGVKLHEQDISALKDCTGSIFYDYDSQYLETLPNGEGAKIVSWSYRNPNKWQMAGVSDIARNFEEQNPGWLVVGGTNADFFNINTNGQMVSNAMEKGDMINPTNITDNKWWRGILGFTKDNQLMTGIPEVSNYYTTFTTEVGSTKVDNINPTNVPQTGVTVLTKDVLKEYDLTGFKVAVGTYDVTRITYSNRDFFVKGKITEVRDGLANDRPKEDDRAFFIVTKDENVNFTKDTYVRIQKDYLNDWANVYNSASYYWKILDNGTVMFEGHSNAGKRDQIIAKYGQGYNDLSYITTTKSRCLFGVKEDGSYVMAVVGGSTTSGMTLSEAAYYMKEIGCVNAWDFDGGGSATLVARNELGNIETINVPSDAGDGTERRVGNALLMVVRDPGYTFDIKESTPTTVTLNQKTGADYQKMQDIKVKIANQVVEVDNNEKIVIEGLEENKKYNAEICFTYEGEEYSTFVPVETSIYQPGLTFIPNTYGFTVERTSTDKVLETIGATIQVNDMTFTMGNVDSFEITGLVKDQTYRISYTYEVHNKLTDTIYQKAEAMKEYHTLSYDIPQITKFEELRKGKDKITFAYTYTDTDNLVVEAYILKNGEKELLDSKSGTKIFENLDFNTDRYTFKLVIKYQVGEEIAEITSDELISGLEPCEHDFEDATCEKPKTCKKCGATEGKPLGHDFMDATTDAPKTCRRCGKTEGEPLPKTDSKKGCSCKKSGVYVIITSLAMLGASLILLRKKK